MKRLLPVIVFVSLALFVLANPSVSKAATAGPVDIQNLSAKQGPSAGQVTLSWTQHAADVSAYHVIYGTKSVTYQYSALNIQTIGVGKVQSLTISSLNPGQTYYFALVPVKSGYPRKPTMEVTMTATAGVLTPATTQTQSSSPSPSSVVSSAGPAGVTHLTAVSGPKSGEVTLNWTQYNVATTNYNVSYGTSSGKYSYGALNIGNAGVNKMNSFTVKALVPGVRYYFALSPIQNGRAIGWTKEVSVIAR